MQKKTLRRIVVTGLAAPALALGAPAVASADTGYQHSSQSAGSNGASSHSQSASTDGNGGSSYQESHSHAGPNGASESHTSSNAGSQGGLLGGLL